MKNHKNPEGFRISGVMEGDGKDRMERFDDSRIFQALFLPYCYYQASLMKACASSGVCPTYVICFFIYIHLLSLYIFISYTSLSTWPDYGDSRCHTACSRTT